MWPKSNPDFWKRKIETNISRDRKIIELLEERGWNVIVIWECELKKAFASEFLEQLKARILQNWM